MSVSLYELKQVYTEIMDLEVDTETLEAMLFSLKDSIEEKSENICKVMNQMELEEDMLDTEIKRLQAKKKALGTRRSKLKEYLSETLKTLEISTIKGKLFNISFRKSESVVIDKESEIPVEFIDSKIVHSVDKKELKKWLKDHQCLGARIEKKQNIQIK